MLYRLANIEGNNEMWDYVSSFIKPWNFKYCQV